MKKLLILCCLMLGLPVAVQAGSDKIDPATYVCAELITQPIADGGQPPVFEGLQIDGYVSAKMGNPIADPETLAPMLGQVYAACQANPTKKAATVWQEARKTFPVDTTSTWRADKSLCKDYTANPDDGSVFVIWLDGYNQGKSDKTASVLTRDDTLKAYLDACSKKPDSLMLDVLAESAK